ncbi:MAG: HesA/MoeB/ThiF family protein [Planctomycetes bacterium]|nr:HesA/MoeB/ThiF family protein [Planctomycetota bacterium]
MGLNELQKQRYSRHILLEGVDEEGQSRLLESRVLVIGCGGLGSPVCLYLAAAGVGTIGIVDPDQVDLSNLQRQIAHHTPDIGVDKVESAKNKISAMNPDVKVETHKVWAGAGNIREIIAGYDFVIDATDNFSAKFLINDACFFERKPLCHAGVVGFEGQLMTIIPGQTACYRCIFDAPPPDRTVAMCGDVGVLCAVPGVIGTLQATEAMKYILGIGDLAVNSLVTYNAINMSFRKITLGRNRLCSLCGEEPKIKDLGGFKRLC